MSNIKKMSEDLVKKILKHISDCYIIVDRDDYIIHWSEQATRIFKFTETESLGKNIKEHLRLERDKLKPSSEFSSGIKAFDKLGTHLRVTPLSSNSYIDENGERFTIWIFRDISRKKQIDQMMDMYTDNLYTEYSILEAKKTKELLEINKKLKKTLLEKKAEIKRRIEIERELINLRNLLSNIIGSMPSALISLDCNKYVTLWNREAESLTSLMARDRLGLPLPDEIIGLIGSDELIDEVLESGKSKKIEKVKGCFTKEIRYYDITIFPIENSIIEGVVIRLDDITKRLQIQELMIQTEKMVSLGSIAAGIAHEVNNPLAGVSQNTQVIMQRLTKDIPANIRAADETGIELDSLRAYLKKRDILSMLESVTDSTEKAAKIIKDMLDFSYKTNTVIKRCDILDLLNRSIKLIKSDYTLKKSYNSQLVEITKYVSSKHTIIDGDPVKLQQVFFNLLKNAIQALYGYKNPKIIIRLHDIADHLRIEVEDNGPGMELESQKRVFEPFYTTKDIGVGTGLGLSISYFIITDNHKGAMSVTSSPGKGTCFTIELPFVTYY